MSDKLQTLMKLGESLSVLYVEDSEVVRESTLDMLNEYFKHVDTAVDGEDGLQKYRDFYENHARHYDIVLTDINMPKMNGIEMVEKILAIKGEQNVVIISAHNEADYLLKLINMGVSNFILKPIEITQFQKILFRMIEAVLNQKAVSRQQEELKTMNRVLQAAKEEAEQASLQKSQFLANMSHEIRTPLNAIAGFISLLHEKEIDAEKIKYLEVIKSSTDSLLQIISDILDISKIESGKLEVDAISFCPYKDLITVVELFQEKAAQNGIVFNVEYSNNMPDLLFSDVHRIKQILSNLLSNAVKFTPKGSSIECSVAYDEGSLNIRIEDHGIGIAEEKQKYVFESFIQAENSTSREYGGTGLGLAISSRLARLLGGTLTLESELGRGSTFTLSIDMPIAESREQEPEEEVVSKAPLKGHVLIVEDIAANRMFLSIILDNAGLTHETAINGLEAIEKFKTEKYDLILMDENMPKLGGIAATKEILIIEKEKDLKHTPIISLTANALKGDKERFLKAGMDDYLSKPIELDMLISTMRKFLG